MCALSKRAYRGTCKTPVDAVSNRAIPHVRAYNARLPGDMQSAVSNRAIPPVRAYNARIPVDMQNPSRRGFQPRHSTCARLQRTHTGEHQRPGRRGFQPRHSTCARLQNTPTDGHAERGFQPRHPNMCALTKRAYQGTCKSPVGAVANRAIPSAD